MEHRAITIERIQNIAIQKGGRCLSEQLDRSGRMPRVRLQCDEGHTWSAAADHVLYRGTWCPQCRSRWRKLSIDTMREIARSRGGECLSPAYINTRTKLLWRCAKGHEWLAQPDMVKNEGTWCPDCARTKKKDLAYVQRIAVERGGRCLSKEYRNMHTLMTWECGKGHRWEAKPATVIHNKAWCAACYGTKRKNMEEMRKLAKKKGGRCLSRDYVNTKTHLLWQCRRGHVWRASPNRIEQGTWCPNCNQWPRRTIEAAQAIAKGKGGVCLSLRFVTNDVSCGVAARATNGGRLIPQFNKEHGAPGVRVKVPWKRPGRIGKGSRPPSASPMGYR